MKLVTMKRLHRALADVRRELDRLEVWTEKISQVEVYLVPAGTAYGWKWDGPKGHISIPAVSTSRLGYQMFGRGFYYSLRNTLRHEYGHAYADVYRRLTQTRAFHQTFGGAYGDWSAPYEDRPSERFADSFADFVRKQGTSAHGCPYGHFLRNMFRRIKIRG